MPKFIVMPPHVDAVGGQSTQFSHERLQSLLHIYSQQVPTKLCDLSKQKIANNVCVTLFRGMSLSEYITVRRIYCQHCQTSSKCEPLLNIAELVLEHGYVQLSEAFRSSYPTQKYKSDLAIARILQMPLVCIKPKQTQMWLIVEFVDGTNYSKLALFLDAMAPGKERALMSKADVNCPK